MSQSTITTTLPFTKLLFCFFFCCFFTGMVNAQQAPIKGEQPQGVEDEFQPEVEGVTVEVWAENLTVPWTLLFLPNGDALVAQRPGSIVRVPKGSSEQVPFLDVPQVVQKGDAGLMGMALHPDFENEPYIYAMHAYEDDQGGLVNRVVRFEYQGDTATLDRVVFDDIPGHAIHIGGRIAFGPDGMLYVGTGYRDNPKAAQDLDSLAGKILRITPEGDIPLDNPFDDSPIYSYGHRVVQGLAWDPETGAMFNSEHGPSGEDYVGEVGQRDEINRVEKGGNYGWPEVVGAPGITEYNDPIVMWKDASVPPAGMAFHKGDLYVATLKSQALVRIVFGDDYQVEKIERWFASSPTKGVYGRIRDVTVGPDGHLYITTSNTDGRAELRPNDDKILRLVFEERE